MFFRHQVYRSEDVYLLVGDEVVVTKADESTHGLDRFFASLRQTGAGACLLRLALVSVQAGVPFPCASSSRAQRRGESCQQGQGGGQEGQGTVHQAATWASEGQQEHPQSQRALDAGVIAYHRLARRLLHLIAGVVALTYIVLDGHFGNHHALQMARQSNLHLISKLRYDAALYFPTPAPTLGGGPSQVWREGQLRRPSHVRPQRDHGRGAHGDLCLSDATAP